VVNTQPEKRAVTNKHSNNKQQLRFDSFDGKQMLAQWKQRIKCVATDVDGTLTMESADTDPRLKGCVAPEAYGEIRRLSSMGIQVVLVSGRPLATIEGLAMYMGLVDRERTECGCPLIAENGAVYKYAGEIIKLADKKKSQKAVDMMQLEGVLPKKDFLTYDNYLRYCDIGIDSAAANPEKISEWVTKHQELGIQALTSSIMTHIVEAHVSKAAALLELTKKMNIGKEEVAVFGDSATDVSLFGEFPMSVCVANYFDTVADWKSRPLPTVRSALPGGAGFAEVVSGIF
jgi:hydroxymethylpyrimidine pyrophosphatase-like HAD family hydrolase